jgi:hypothetical protein
VYQYETDETMALEFEDIPLINRLRFFHKKFKINKSNTSNSSKNYLPWSDIIDVLEKLRFEADLETKKAKDKRAKRALSGRAGSLQKFVLLGFFVLVPPPRQRVVRELELGRTLKYGLFEDGRFIPFENMAHPNEAKYYIHLQPEDYKTGDTYLEWLGEFPNVEFANGCKFYDYINRWLFQGYRDKESGEWHGMRELMASAGERTVFVTEITGRPYNDKRMWQTITNIFVRWTGVSISPHDLRHIYRSYIEDPATGAMEAELKSAAYWMRHSDQTAKTVYAHLNCEQKLQAGAQLSERLNQQLLQAEPKHV